MRCSQCKTSMVRMLPSDDEEYYVCPRCGHEATQLRPFTLKEIDGMNTYVTHVLTHA